MTFQPLGSVAAALVEKLNPRPLVIDGKFDTQAIAERVANLWADREEYLNSISDAAYRATQFDFQWSAVTEKVWREVGSAQAQWFLDNVPTVYTPEEKTERAVIEARHRRLPIYEHDEFRQCSWALQRIDNIACRRTCDEAAARLGITRDRASAFADVSDPRGELAQAAE